jgi:Flp pilus assembly protein TadG
MAQRLPFHSSNSKKWRVRILRDLFANREGSQLLEFAFVLPFLLVFVVGILDFGGAYNLKQKLNNASREAARFAASENSGGSLSTADVNAVRDVVSSYLTNANVTQCAISTAPSGVTGFVYTYNSSSTGCGSSKFLLVIDRNYLITSGTTTVASTHVTLTYPYTWTLGQMIGFILPSSTLNAALPTKISTDAVMQNLN